MGVDGSQLAFSTSTALGVMIPHILLPESVFCGVTENRLEIMGCIKGILRKEHFPNSVILKRRWVQSGAGFFPKLGMYCSVCRVFHAAQ